MRTNQNFNNRARTLQWADLKTLWADIKNKQTPGWGLGKAFECLIIRSFELSFGEELAADNVYYPYDVEKKDTELNNNSNTSTSQTDGLIYVNQYIPFFIEAKDIEKVDLGAILKFRHRIVNRSPLAMGCFFHSRFKGTEEYWVNIFKDLEIYSPKHILFWSESDIDVLFSEQNFPPDAENPQLNMLDILSIKYKHLILVGNPYYPFDTYLSPINV